MRILEGAMRADANVGPSPARRATIALPRDLVEHLWWDVVGIHRLVVAAGRELPTGGSLRFGHG